MNNYTCVFCRSVFELWMNYGARIVHYRACQSGVYATVKLEK